MMSHSIPLTPTTITWDRDSVWLPAGMTPIKRATAPIRNFLLQSIAIPADVRPTAPRPSICTTPPKLDLINRSQALDHLAARQQPQAPGLFPDPLFG